MIPLTKVRAVLLASAIAFTGIIPAGAAPMALADPTINSDVMLVRDRATLGAESGRTFRRDQRHYRHDRRDRAHERRANRSHDRRDEGRHHRRGGRDRDDGIGRESGRNHEWRRDEGWGRRDGDWKRHGKRGGQWPRIERLDGFELREVNRPRGLDAVLTTRQR